VLPSGSSKLITTLALPPAHARRHDRADDGVRRNADQAAAGGEGESRSRRIGTVRENIELLVMGGRQM
jgi:hypothetical protein